MSKFYPFLSILFIVSLFTVSTSLLSQKNSYALLIGVSKYPANSDWQQLSSVNDLELISRSLQKFGIPEKNINFLKDAQVTKKAFLEEIKTSLIDKVKPGDFAYFHFSGHGQQIPDKNGDEVDGLDEALVPINSPKLFAKGVYEGENLITDDELAIAFNTLRKKLGPQGRLMVTLDACHSGSATRGRQTARGTNIIMADASYMANAKLVQSDLLMNDIELNSTDPSLAPEILFYSSSPNQLSYECTENNKSYGLFSYAFCKSLSQISSDDSYRELWNRIALIVTSKSEIQTPYAEGKIQERVFGKGIKASPNYFTIKKIIQPDVFVLGAGAINGITKGSKVAIYDINNSKKTIATAKVDEVRAFESDLVLESKLKKVKVQNLKAFITQVQYSELKIKLKFVSDNDSLKLVIKNNLSKNPMITWSDKEEDLLLELKKYNSDSMQITLSNFDGDILYSNRCAMNENLYYIRDQINDRISKYTRAKRLIALETKDDFLKGKIELLVKDSSNKYSPIQTNEIKVGSVVKIKVTNYGSNDFYFSIFDIQPNANIKKIIPNEEEGKTAIDYSLKSDTFNLSEEFKIHKPYGTEVLKLVCTKTPVEFGMAGNKHSGSNSSIQTLLNYLSEPGNETRGIKPVLSSEEGFIGSLFFKIVK